MKIYVIRAANIIRCSIIVLVLIVAVAVAVAIGISRTKTFEVTASNRDLPIYYVDYPEKKIAITFDCAWGSDDIPDILDTLERENIKATFFIIGHWAKKFPDAVRAISEKGHDVANHSYSHLRMTGVDIERIKREILMCSQQLEEITGKKVDLFRPPYGDYNNNVVKGARDLGYYTIQWDVDSLDWKPGISQSEILNRVTSKVKNGSILLFHNDTPHTAKLLPNIIAALRKQGYDFLPVSQMILRENFMIDHDGKQMKKE